MIARNVGPITTSTSPQNYACKFAVTARDSPHNAMTETMSMVTDVAATAKSKSASLALEDPLTAKMPALYIDHNSLRLSKQGKVTCTAKS
jgi:hypothetical protein